MGNINDGLQKFSLERKSFVVIIIYRKLAMFSGPKCMIPILWVSRTEKRKYLFSLPSVITHFSTWLWRNYNLQNFLWNKNVYGLYMYTSLHLIRWSRGSYFLRNITLAFSMLLCSLIIRSWNLKVNFICSWRLSMFFNIFVILQRHSDNIRDLRKVVLNFWAFEKTKLF